MRDNHQGYPELLGTYARDGLYFGVVRVVLSGEAAAFEFGVEQSGHAALKRILQTRPFDKLGAHRYFFTGSFTSNPPDSSSVIFSVRIEQGAAAKNFDFEGPASLVSNLLWFQALKNLAETAALKRLPTPG